MNARTRSAQPHHRQQGTLPGLVEFSRYGALQLRRDRATQMAAALAFRTLFGLLPVLVVATVLVKALGMEDWYLEPLGRLFSFCGLNHLRIIPPAGAGLAVTTTLDTWMQDRVRDAHQVNVAAIGWVGVTLTLYAAISLMVTIENCFNLIYRAPRGRAWSSRIPVYWFVLTLSPLLLIFSTYLDTQFQRLMARCAMQGALSTLAGAVWTLFAMWLLMFSAYMLFPNTRVRARPAMVGALVSAALLETGKRTMGLYLQNALSVGQLYGSLGLVPLFMFWVYLMWLAVLFGLEVSAVLQRHAHGWLAEPCQETGQGTPAEADLVSMIVKRLADRLDMHKVANHESSEPTTGPQGDSPETVPFRRNRDRQATAGLLDGLRRAHEQASNCAE